MQYLVEHGLYKIGNLYNGYKITWIAKPFVDDTGVKVNYIYTDEPEQQVVTRPKPEQQVVTQPKPKRQIRRKQKPDTLTLEEQETLKQLKALRHEQSNRMDYLRHLQTTDARIQQSIPAQRT